MNKILHGDSLDLLKDMDDNSVDSIVTDPPYGYSFMGKDWDKALPSIDIWKECVRVLKPGGFAFIMSAPRSDVHSRMCLMLEEAGFNIGFTPIAWTYATGFPKASNIGKMVDKRLGKERKVIGERESFGRENRKTDMGFGKSEIYADGSIKPKIDITLPSTPQAKALDGSYGGFQPKPAWENVIVCMKPLSEKGYLDQAMKDGKGVTWLDDCRIPFSEMSDEEQFEKDNVAGMMNFDGEYEKGSGKNYEGGWKKPKRIKRVSAFGDSSQSETKDGRNLWGKEATKVVEVDDTSPMGRFPANLLVQDDVLNNGKTTKSTGGLGDINVETKFGQTSNRIQKPFNYQDEGSFSRYYDLDAWWEERIKELPLNVQATYPFLIVPKASKSEKNKGCDELNEKQKIFNGQSSEPSEDMKGVEKKFTTLPSKNFHPTVKPISLMSYLVTLGSRKDDLVLDPFVGSGTTCIAAKLMNRKYIGMEMNDEYVVIAQERIKTHEPEKQQHNFF